MIGIRDSSLLRKIQTCSGARSASYSDCTWWLCPCSVRTWSWPLTSALRRGYELVGLYLPPLSHTPLRRTQGRPSTHAWGQQSLDVSSSTSSRHDVPKILQDSTIKSRVCFCTLLTVTGVWVYWNVLTVWNLMFKHCCKKYCMSLCSTAPNGNPGQSIRHGIRPCCAS